MKKNGHNAYAYVRMIGGEQAVKHRPYIGERNERGQYHGKGRYTSEVSK